MTIRVGVINLDSRLAALIRVRAVTTDGKFIPGGFQALLKGSQKTEVYIHSGQQIEVCEVPPEVPEARPAAESPVSESEAGPNAEAEPVAEVPTGSSDSGSADTDTADE